MIAGGWSLKAIGELDYEQVELFAAESFRIQGEQQAAMISAINLGSHGKPDDIRRTIKRLTSTASRGETPETAMGVEALIQAGRL